MLLNITAMAPSDRFPSCHAAPCNVRFKKELSPTQGMCLGAFESLTVRCWLPVDTSMWISVCTARNTRIGVAILVEAEARALVRRTP